MRRDPRPVGDREHDGPLPLRPTALFLSVWVVVLVVLAFVVVPALFATCTGVPPQASAP